MRILRLGVSGLRNLPLQSIEPSRHFTVIFGANGQGKSAWLEAVSLLCRAQSFRTSDLRDVLQHGASELVLHMRIEQDGAQREQQFALRDGRRALQIDGKRPQSLMAYAVRTPLVVFHPGELLLSMGSAQPRRALLDRLAFFRAPGHAKILAEYNQAQRARLCALRERGAAARELAQYEQLIVERGAQVMRLRAQAAADLDQRAQRAFSALAAEDLQLRSEYQPSAPLEPEAYARRLHEDRLRDMSRGATSCGPHRDDWRLWINGHEARRFASQGQHRALVIAIKSAEIEGIANACKVQPIVLLDDVSSELDRQRTRALFAFLQKQRSQVFLTTTRPELIELAEGSERVDFLAEGGLLTRQRS